MMPPVNFHNLFVDQIIFEYGFLVVT